jgi:uncharacterized membrane protein
MLNKPRSVRFYGAKESPLTLGTAMLILLVVWGPIVGAALVALVRVVAIISS